MTKYKQTDVYRTVNNNKKKIKIQVHNQSIPVSKVKEKENRGERLPATPATSLKSEQVENNPIGLLIVCST